MFKKNRFGLIFLLLGFFLLVNGKSSHAKNGFMDLSKEDWKSESHFNLDGDWLVVWNRLLSPREVDDYYPKQIIQVPLVWNRVNGLNHFMGAGYATYYLKIVIPKAIVQKQEPLALKIGEIMTAYHLDINNQWSCSNGVPGANSESSTPFLKPQTLFFTPNSDTLNITIRLSNFHYRSGGFVESLILGKADKVSKLSTLNIIKELFLVGSLIMIALYHLTIYLFRRKEKSSLWFALVCLLIATRTLMVGENIVCQFLPFLGWELQNKIEYWTFFLVIPCFILFIESLYPSEMIKRLNGVFCYLSIAYFLLALFTPALVYSQLNLAFQAAVIMVIFYILWVLVKAFVKKEDGVVLLFGGFVILSITTINDILLSRQTIESVPLATYGTFIFLFSQAILLSRRYSTTFKELEETSQRLMGSYRELKESQDMVVKQEKLASLGTLTAGIAHEINNPAQSIKFSMNGLELNILDLERLIDFLQDENRNNGCKESWNLQLKKLLEELDTETLISELRSTIDDNLSAVKRIENIVQSTKRYARLDDAMTTCNLNEIINDSLLLVVNQLKHDVQITTDLAPELPDFFVSPQEISQVIINLLTNAKDAILEKDLPFESRLIEIKSGFHVEEKAVFLQVSDNGTGISQKHIDKIFDPFYTTKPIGKGTGLGLNIVYKIVEKHNGEITVQSQKKRGTTFVINWPISNKTTSKKSFSISESGG